MRLRPRNRVLRLRELDRLEDEARRELENAERDGRDEIHTVTVEPFAESPRQREIWDQREAFASLPSGLDAVELGRQLWLTDEQGNDLPASPEQFARYQRAKATKPKRQPPLDPSVEIELFNHMDEVRDWEKAYAEANDDWRTRRRLRNKRPEPYAAPGQSCLEAAEQRVHGYARAREREVWAAGEQRRMEELETERQLARVRAEKIIEEEERKGVVAPTGAWAVKREAGLEHPRQGEPNRISESSKVGVRKRLRFAARVGKEALTPAARAGDSGRD